MSQTSLADLDIDQGDATYHSEDFKCIIEQNLTYIKNYAANVANARNIANLPPAEAAACHGDFRKVAAFLNIPLHMVWVVMRVNNLNGYEDYSKEMLNIILPDFELIYRLKQNDAVIQKYI